MRLIERALDRLGEVLMIVAGAAVGVAILHITTDVILRYMLKQPLPGTIAIVINYYMPMMAFLPVAYTQRVDGHIVVDLFTGMLPKAVQRHVIGCVYLFCALLFALLTWTTWVEALNKLQRGTFTFEDGIVILTWVGHFLPPIGYGLATLVLVAQFLRYVTGKDIAAPKRRTDDYLQGGAA
jgi:TRAP-type C4-dicarboxylate transport system permease small subunit